MPTVTYHPESAPAWQGCNIKKREKKLKLTGIAPAGAWTQHLQVHFTETSTEKWKGGKKKRQFSPFRHFFFSNEVQFTVTVKAGEKKLVLSFAADE
jgi:hypothetical protein